MRDIIPLSEAGQAIITTPWRLAEQGVPLTLVLASAAPERLAAVPSGLGALFGPWRGRVGATRIAALAANELPGPARARAVQALGADLSVVAVATGVRVGDPLSALRDAEAQLTPVPPTT